MKKHLLLLSVIALVGLITALFANGPVALAGQCAEGETATSFDFGGGANGCVTNGNGIDNNPLTVALLTIINVLAVGVGIVVVGGIIYGGFLYTTSNGNAAQTKQGVSTIINAVIGLLLFAFLYATVNFLVPGGLFN